MPYKYNNIISFPSILILISSESNNISLALKSNTNLNLHIRIILYMGKERNNVPYHHLIITSKKKNLK